MTLIHSMSPMALTLTAIMLGSFAYGIGGAIGYFSFNYNDKDNKQWLEDNKANLTSAFYDEQTILIAKRASNRTIDSFLRMRTYRIASVLLLAILFFISPTFHLLASLSVVFFTLLWLSAIDIDSHTVPERPLFFMTIALLGLSVFSPPFQWVNAQGALLGTFMVFVFITASIQLTRWLIKVTGKKKDLIFGDGDVLVLVALALYFGIDALISLGFASLFFVLANLASPFYLSCLARAGHFPISTQRASEEGMAFVPFILLGLLTTVGLHLTGLLDLSSNIVLFYELVMIPQ